VLYRPAKVKIIRNVKISSKQQQSGICVKSEVRKRGYDNENENSSLLMGKAFPSF
jgi:hypothetical protein